MSHSPAPGYTWDACDNCGTVSHLALTDAMGFFAPIAGCCLCTLVPIDDPDAGKAIEEDLALPIDPRKIGEPA